MQVKLGSKVYGADDQPMGTVSHVILYPGTKEVTHLAIQIGHASLGQELVPVDQVYSADEKRVVLRSTTQDLAHLPGSQAGGDMSVESGVQSARSPATLGNAPEGTVALKEGAKVVTSDGQNVGNVERLTTVENQVTELVIAKGKLLKSRKAIPTELISSILGSEVRLNVDSAFVDSLSEPMQQV